MYSNVYEINKQRTSSLNGSCASSMAGSVPAESNLIMNRDKRSSSFNNQPNNSTLSTHKQNSSLNNPELYIKTPQTVAGVKNKILTDLTYAIQLV